MLIPHLSDRLTNFWAYTQFCEGHVHLNYVIIIGIYQSLRLFNYRMLLLESFSFYLGLIDLVLN